jgi:hypothetical protein
MNIEQPDMSLNQNLEEADEQPVSRIITKEHADLPHPNPYEEWAKQAPTFEAIETMGIQRFADNLPDIEEAFHLEDHCVRCMDEGTPGGIHLAGSGILMDEAKAIEAMRAAHADGVYSHDGCGAAALYAKKMGLDASKSDEYGVIWAKHLAELLGVPYKGNIEKKKLKRPEAFHFARVAYYDGTGSFDPTRVADLPPGFVISRRYIDADAATAEADIATSIATGHHGYNELITAKEPFYIIPVGDPADPNFSIEKLTRELDEIVAKSGGRVKVTGFTRPIEVAKAA